MRWFGILLFKFEDKSSVITIIIYLRNCVYLLKYESKACSKTLLYSLFLVCTATYSQVGGKYTYQFLNLVTSPRRLLIGKTLIYDDDVNQVNFNATTNVSNHLALEN
jgi:hypothetical protein